MHLKDIIKNEKIRKIDNEINIALERAHNYSKLELRKIGCDKYLKKTYLHGADLTGSSLYYGLYLYFFCKQPISGFRENVIGLVFEMDIKNLDNVNIEVSIESVYKIKNKKLNLKDLHKDQADSFFNDIITMFITSINLFIRKELSMNGVIPKKLILKC